jgi:PKD repeat protein
MGHRSHARAVLGTILVLGLSVGLSALGGTSNLPHAIHASPKFTFKPDVATSADPAPAASTTLLSTGATPTLISFSWTKSTSLIFSSYALEGSASGASGPWTVYANLTTASENYDYIYGQTPGASSWWQVLTWTDYIIGYSESGSNVAQVQQPVASNLTYTTLSPTSVQLNWTNSAEYGGNLSFVNYTVYQTIASGAPTVNEVLDSVGSKGDLVSGLSSGASYSFFVATADRAAATEGQKDYSTDSNSINFGTPATLEANATGQPAAADAASLVTFSCRGSGGVTPYQFAWTFGDGSNGTGATTSHAYSTPGNYTATCTVTDAAHTTTQNTSAVHISPHLNVRIFVNSSVSAPGTLLGFASNASGGPGGALSYQWNFGAGLVAGAANETYAFATAGLHETGISVTDRNGVTASDTVLVNVSAIQVSASASQAVGLEGSSFGFNASASGGAGGPYNYTWDFGDDSTGYGNITRHAFNSAGTFPVTLLTRDALGAVNTSNVSSIVVFAHLAIQIVLTTQSPVADQSVNLSAKVTGGSGSVVCQWNFGDGGSAAGCQARHAWTSSGAYAVKLNVTDRLAGTQTSSENIEVAAQPPASGKDVTPAHPGSANNSLWLWAIAAASLLGVGFVISIYALRRRGRSSTSAAPESPSKPQRASCPSCGAAIPTQALLCPRCHQLVRQVKP